MKGVRTNQQQRATKGNKAKGLRNQRHALPRAGRDYVNALYANMKGVISMTTNNNIDSKLIRKCIDFAKANCASYINGTCVCDDCPCHVVNPKYATIADGAVSCDYFLDAVLPANPELDRLVKNEIYYGNDEDRSSANNVMNCSLCGHPFVPNSPRQKYCSACGEIMEAERTRERKRRQRAKNVTVLE